MKPLVLGILIFPFLSANVLSSEPKSRPTPHPANVLISVTFKMTEFAWHRITGEPTNTPVGMRHPELSCNFADVLEIGESRHYARKKKGEFAALEDPESHFLLCTRDHGHEYAEVSADDLRDIFGSDALRDVREVPWDEFQRQEQAKEFQAIQDALKKSKGNTTEAVERLKMNGIDITEQELLQKVNQFHVAIPGR